MIDKYHSALVTLNRESPLLMLGMEHHRNLRGGPMTYGTLPFLAPMMHTFPDLGGADVISGVQTGKSELFILMMLYSAGVLGRITAYILPTFAVRSRFVKTRIDPLLQDVPFYRDRLPGGAPGLSPETAGKGSQALKMFGGGTMMFLGSNTPTDFIEFSADALFIDELDQCEPGNLTKARDRIRASAHPQLFRLGNPTLPNVGIDRLYRRSNMQRWYYKCPSCSERQPLDWFVNVVRRRDDGAWEPRDRERAGLQSFEDSGFLRPVRGDIRPVCRKCERPFERAEAWWAWVAENPSALRPGYHMTRIDVLHQSLRELFAEWVDAQGSTDLLATFYTSNLGIAYEDSGRQVTVEDLRAAATGEENDYVGGPEYEDELVVMGIDVGSILNVNIDCIRLKPPAPVAEGEEETEMAQPTVQRVGVFVGAVVRPEEIDDLIERFHVDCVVIDAQPEARMAQDLRDRWSGDVQVWLCRFYGVPRVGRQRFGLTMDWKSSVVSVDRTQVLDAAYDDIRAGNRVFPEDVFTVLGWSDQMRAPKRVLDAARSKIIWTEGSAADHYRLSDVYALVAFEVSQQGGTYGAV